MSHHKRAAAPQTSLSSIPSLFCFERSVRASWTRPITHAGKSASAQRACMVTTALRQSFNHNRHSVQNLVGVRPLPDDPVE